MKPYPFQGCAGLSCRQGREPCKTRRQCGFPMVDAELIQMDGGNVIDYGPDEPQESIVGTLGYALGVVVAAALIAGGVVWTLML